MKTLQSKSTKKKIQKPKDKGTKTHDLLATLAFLKQDNVENQYLKSPSNQRRLIETTELLALRIH